MSTKTRRKSSPEPVPTTGSSTATQSQSVSGGYIPANLRAERRRTPAGSLVIRLGIILGLALLAWAALMVFAPDVLPPFLRPIQKQPELYFAGERISFVRTSGEGKRDLYVVNSDGTNQQQITRDIVVDGFSSWSRDGKQIMMQAQIGGISRIVRYTIGPDNKPAGSAYLTADIEADSVLPAWSPDNSRIAFQTKRDGGDYQVYVMDSNGNGKQRLSDGKGYAGQPAWSPDGMNIIYVSGEKADPGTAKELFIVPASGGAPRQITSLGKDLSRPAWSPDGRNIVYVQNQGERNRTIFVANVDGSSPRVLVDVGTNSPPLLSPVDGKAVYSVVSPTTGSDIFTVPLSGGTPTNISPQASEDYNPAWSTDGKKLAWASRIGENFRIVTANADGSDLQQVSHGEGEDYQPAWGAPVK